MKSIFGLVLLISSVAFAGEHQESSIKELAWPAFNFIILFSLIFWKAKKPIHDIFTEKSRKVQELFRFAENKHKEAKNRHDQLVEKLKNVEQESEQIMHEARIEAEHMEKRVHDEIQERMQRMWDDSHHLVETERRQLETELNQEIVETIIKKTKEKIVNDKELQKKTTKNILVSVK